MSDELLVLLVKTSDYLLKGGNVGIAPHSE